MKKNFWKKTAAAVLALTLVSGGVPVMPGAFALPDIAITASAADMEWDAETQTLTLHGKIVNVYDEENEIYGVQPPAGVSKEDVLHIVVDEDAVLPVNCRNLFLDFTNVQSIDLTNVSTAHVTNMSHMFAWCRSLEELDVSGFDTAKVTDMSGIFLSCRALTGLDVSGFDTSNVTDMSSMFNGCECVPELNVSGFETSKVTDVSCMFAHCKLLTELDVSGFDTAKVTDMVEMFFECVSLKELNVSGFDTSNVTDMSDIFWLCSSLKELDVSGFDTSNATRINGMFKFCESLTALDVSGFDTSNVTNMSEMFRGCRALQAVDVSGFDTSNVTNMRGMFWACWALKELNVSGFDTSNVKDMGYMFLACHALKTLDLSSFDTSNVTDMGEMFQSSDGLKTVIVSDNWSTEKLRSPEERWYYDARERVFYGCSNLIGGSGTVFDSSNVNADYAHIDGGAENPGYLTGVQDITEGISVSLTLQDDLGLNFYIDGANADNCNTFKVRFHGKCAENHKFVSLTEKNGKYCATANVYATDMAEPVTAYIYNENVLLGKVSCSVEQYLDRANPDTGWNAAKKAAFSDLVSSVKQYGEVSHAYFNTPDAMPDVANYTAEINAGNFAPSFASNQATISLVLDSRLAARLYVKNLPEGAQAKFGDETLTAVRAKDGRYCFEITGIKPTQLAGKMTVSYGGTDYTFAPLSWSYRVSSADGMPEAETVMANALYEYYAKASAFAGA